MRIIVPVFLVLLAFAACEDGGSFEEPTPVPPFDDDDSSGDDDDDAVDDDDAAGPCAGPTLDIEFTIAFPATEGCAWGEDGNDDATQGETSARTEQEVELRLPDNAVVCGLSLDFEEFERREDPEVFFDDHFLFTLNDVVLAADYGDMVDEFGEVNGLPRYDWDDLLGFETEEEPDTFCLGEDDGSDCELPDPGEEGEYSLSFVGDTVDALIASAIEDERFEFGFIVTGDDNPGDCTHRGFQVTLEASLAAE